MSEKKRSKSQRVRDYLRENPVARNRDVVKALAQYGVTAADVSNAKAHLKKIDSETAILSSTDFAQSDEGLWNANAGGQIALSDLQAALNFVDKIGSIDRARQLLVIIQQIQRIPAP